MDAALSCSSTLTADLSTATPLEASIVCNVRVHLDSALPAFSYAFNSHWVLFATGRRTYGGAPRNPAVAGGWVGDDWWPQE